MYALVLRHRPVWASGLLTFLNVSQSVREREVCVYSISCKNQNNIDITIEWLTRHARP